MTQKTKRFAKRYITITSQNVRGLKSSSRLYELDSLFKSRKLFAVCIQETWKNGHTVTEYDNHTLILNGLDSNADKSRRGKEGVGIALSRDAVKSWKDAGSEIFTDFGSRILAIRLSLKDPKQKNVTLYLVSAYAPVGVADQTIWQQFLDTLEKCIRNKQKDDVLLICCDTNSSIRISEKRLP